MQLALKYGVLPPGYEVYLLLQTTCYDDMSWSYDTTSVGVYGVFTDFGSNVIKGSFPV